MLFKKEFLAQKKSLNLKENTLKTYEDYLTRFEAWLCEAKGVKYLQKQTITGLSTADVQKYITELKKHYSKATVAIHLASIKEFYNYLLHNNIIASNPTYGVRIPKDEVNVKRRHMTLTEGQDILSSVTDTRDRAIMTLGMVMGLRREEIATLTVDGIDFQNDTITLIRKGSKLQTLPILKDARDVLAQYYGEVKSKGHKYLFQSPRGVQPISLVQVHNIVKKYSEFGTHENRRITAKSLVSKDVSLSVVQKFLNHESMATTNRYIRHEDSEIIGVLRGL